MSDKTDESIPDNTPTNRQNRLAYVVDECAQVFDELCQRYPRLGRDALTPLAAAAVIHLAIWDLQDSLESDIRNVANAVENIAPRR